MTWFPSATKGSKPQNYYRSGVKQNDFRLEMQGAGPLSVTQIAAMLSDKIPPEAKARHFELYEYGHKPSPSTSIETRMFLGARRIVHLRIKQLIHQGKVKKHGSGKEARYEWIEGEGDTAKVDSPGRGHAVKKGTKRGCNKGVRRPHA